MHVWSTSNKTNHQVQLELTVHTKSFLMIMRWGDRVNWIEDTGGGGGKCVWAWCSFTKICIRWPDPVYGAKPSGHAKKFRTIISHKRIKTTRKSSVAAIKMCNARISWNYASGEPRALPSQTYKSFNQGTG